MKRSNTLKNIPQYRDDLNSNSSNLKEIGIIEGDFDFDKFEQIRCEKHAELKANFMISETEEFKKHEIICSTCLAELNSKYNDSIKSKLYSAIIVNEKEKIVKIKEDKINFDLFYLGKSLHVHTYNKILSSGDKLNTFFKSFDENVIDKFSYCKTTPEDVAKIKNFIVSILDSKNEPILKNIGFNEDLKIRYIKLAYFLLQFKGLKENQISYNGLTENLKKHILDIVEKRNEINRNIKKWLKLVLKELYSHTHELEEIPYDQEFFRSIPLGYIGKEASLEIERLKKIIEELKIENEILKHVIIFIK
jgi:hypothetical protein